MRRNSEWEKVVLPYREKSGYEELTLKNGRKNGEQM